MGRALRLLPVLFGAMTCVHAQGDAEEVWGIPLKPDPPFAVDGELSDWAAVPNAMSLNQAEQVVWGRNSWQSPQDLSGAAHLEVGCLQVILFSRRRVVHLSREEGTHGTEDPAQIPEVDLHAVFRFRVLDVRRIVAHDFSDRGFRGKHVIERAVRHGGLEVAETFFRDLVGRRLERLAAFLAVQIVAGVVDLASFAQTGHRDSPLVL
jgi:hypothetical protein